MRADQQHNSRRAARATRTRVRAPADGLGGGLHGLGGGLAVAHRVGDWITAQSGGRQRRTAVLLLACVLALDTADLATVGAIAGQLERGLRISNVQLGLLVAIPSLVGAVATVPVGVLTDRVRRVPLLWGSVMIWGIAMVACGLANGFGMLLATRVALGAVTATAGPTVSSLVGDFFPARRRAQIYGTILTGELAGAGFGFLISGEAAAALSWRAGFLILAVPALALAIMIWRLLPEPVRGGGQRLDLHAEWPANSREENAQPSPAADAGLARRKVRECGVRPREELILSSDPAQMSLGQAFAYTLRIPTNVILIITSGLGYFYFSGVQTFGIVYFEGWYGLSHAAATSLIVVLAGGAIAGVVAGGRLADRLLRSGRLDGRIVVGAWSYVIATVCFVPGLLSRSLALSIPLFVVAAAALAARNPPLDAARLDVMHSRLWGRAEAARTVLRRTGVAAAPLLFGLLADAVNSGRSHAAGGHGFGATASPRGLHDALLILLATVAAGGLLTFRAARTYPRDVATAAASEQPPERRDE
jgi:predicted MFS family arabinose efflux permease